MTKIQTYIIGSFLFSVGIAWVNSSWGLLPLSFGAAITFLAIAMAIAAAEPND